MTREKILGIAAATTFLALQGLTILLLSTSTQMKLLLLVLLIISLGSATVILLRRRRQINKLVSAVRSQGSELSTTKDLLEENQALSNKVKELQQAHKKVVKQQTTLFDLALNTDESNASASMGTRKDH